jgi:cyclohexanone monooxygenase
MGTFSEFADELDVEAIVIGAGFAGLRMLQELRRLDVTVRVFEAGTDVGGTWYWNRYPGARTDTEAWAYCFRFDQELLNEWEWPERYPAQPVVQSYLSWVADRLHMRRDITFSTRVTAGRWDEARAQWIVETSSGETLRCKWLISSTGLLSKPLEIPFPGIESFQGQWHSSNQWPKQGVDFTNKRVAIVGTGASAVQIIPEVAMDAETLTVFQRTPNFVLPARNHAISPRQREWVRKHHRELWANVDDHIFAFPWPMQERLWDSCSPEERQLAFDEGWEAGGFHFAFKTFADVLANAECNEAAADYIRQKIRAIVHDPETADKLCPTDHPLFGKRPPLGHFYYETFNEPHVSLVDVKANPVQEITPRGIRTADGVEHEADIIIFALGFDAVTGALMNIDLEGRDGVSIQQRWKSGGQAYLGIFVDGFPNLMSIFGPQTAFTNIPPTIERQAIFIGRAIEEARRRDADIIDAEPDAVRGWAADCQQQLDATILNTGEARSWFLATNVEGKPQTVLFYFGGAGAFNQALDECIDRDFSGLVMAPTGQTVSKT